MKHLYIALTVALTACAQPQAGFTDSDVGCLMDCVAPAQEPPECADDCEAARLGDNLYLTIREGE